VTTMKKLRYKVQSAIERYECNLILVEENKIQEQETNGDVVLL